MNMEYIENTDLVKKMFALSENDVKLLDHAGAFNGCAVSHLKRMLRTTDKSVKEIAFEAGFDNLSFFGKYVRRWLGMSPREYRMQQGK